MYRYRLLKILSSLLCIWLSTANNLSAQRHEIYTERIQSLQVIADDDWMRLPVYELGNGKISISFDDMTHDIHRYKYSLQHCEADWTISDGIFDSDFCEGFAEDNLLENYSKSINTNHLYTHYNITLPNSNCAPKLSGNYKLTVYDEEQPVLTACFMVTEPEGRQMNISFTPTTNTDLSINEYHQQMSIQLGYGGYTVNNPQQQIQTVVVQNGQWHDARYNAKPQYVMGYGLKWDHCRDYIFTAGNEYRKFEILSTDVASMGIDKIAWDGSEFNAYPFVCTPRPHYIYDEDADGAFLLRNSDNYESDIQSEYMIVHFQLQCAQPVDGDVYVNGDWTLDRFLPKYKMEYDAEKKMYETDVLLKLGYYSYQFVWVNKEGNMLPMPTEGCFYQTENKYEALAYFREQGGRTDRLVGYKKIEYRP